MICGRRWTHLTRVVYTLRVMLISPPISSRKSIYMSDLAGMKGFFAFDYEESNRTVGA